MRHRIKVEWEKKDGSLEGTELGEVQIDACLSAADVGLKLATAKEVIGRLQEIVIKRQLRQHCEAARSCPGCNGRRSIKDYPTALGCMRRCSTPG